MPIKQKILAKAHQLFVEQGIRNVTMDGLAQSLGMSKRTIYEQFADKQELVKADAQLFAQQIKQDSERVMKEADNVIQGLAQMMQYFQNMVQTVTPFYFKDMKKFYPNAYECITSKKDVHDFALTTHLVQSGILQGIFRDDVNVKLVCFFLNTTILANHDQMKDVPDLKYGDFEKDVLFTYLLGLATDAGRVLILKEQKNYFENMTMMGAPLPTFNC